MLTVMKRAIVLWSSIVMLALLIFASRPAWSADASIILQSTTSTKNSGLYSYILPLFKKATGIDVHVVAVGTGQAIRNATKGDGDVLLAHAPEAEEQFVNQGYGVARFNVMYNEFVLVGPLTDPASISTSSSVSDALRRIAGQHAVFVSPGDNSRTHIREKQLWLSSSVDLTGASGQWYRETGSGMGATLNIAVGMNAYCFTDRATWIDFNNKADFSILFEGGTELANQYGVVLVNPKKHPHVKKDAGQTFIDWLLGPEGQHAIASYRLHGEQLFFPNAGQ